MARKALKELKENKTMMQLMYGSDFNDTQRKLFEKMRNCYGLTKKTLRVIEFAVAIFGFDIDTVSFENIHSAVDYYLSSGGNMGLKGDFSTVNPVKTVPVEEKKSEPVHEEEPEDDEIVTNVNATINFTENMSAEDKEFFNS